MPSNLPVVFLRLPRREKERLYAYLERLNRKDNISCNQLVTRLIVQYLDDIGEQYTQ